MKSHQKFLNNVWQKMTPAEGPVDVNRYTIYAIIPGFDTYVASKLDKKKSATVYTTIFMVAILAVLLLECITCPLILN